MPTSLCLIKWYLANELVKDTSHRWQTLELCEPASLNQHPQPITEALDCFGQIRSRAAPTVIISSGESQ
jgi:hypothetical protein